MSTIPFQNIKTVTVFCSASELNNPELLAEVEKTIRLVAGTGVRFVYGAGDNGMMGLVARTALDCGNEVYGIQHRQFAGGGPAFSEDHYSEEIQEDFASRIRRMYEEGDVFLTLPGGTGTLQEIMDVLSEQDVEMRDPNKWNRNAKPVILLNYDNFFDGTISQFKRMEKDGTLRPNRMQLIESAPNAEGIMALLRKWDTNPRTLKSIADGDGLAQSYDAVSQPIFRFG